MSYTSKHRKASQCLLPAWYSHSVRAEPFDFAPDMLVEAWTEYIPNISPFTLRPYSGRTDSLIFGFMSLYFVVLNSKPRTTGLLPWLWGTALAGSPEHSPREIIFSVKTLQTPLAAISRGESPPVESLWVEGRLRTGRSVVRPRGSRQVVRGKPAD